MSENQEFRWIAENIDISALTEKLPWYIKDMIHDAEHADRENNFPVYAQVCDDLEIYAKLLVPDILTMAEWHMLCEKYAIVD